MAVKIKLKTTHQLFVWASHLNASSNLGDVTCGDI
jgi:hypothetical protein